MREKEGERKEKMLIPNTYLYHTAALTMVIFGFYVFSKGVKTNEFKVLPDGTLIDSSSSQFINFRQSKAILTFKTGFDLYHTLAYGLSSLCLLIDLVLHSGYLTLPALILTAGEIVTDLSDFCLAAFVFSFYVNGLSGALYGFIYLCLLIFEIIIWSGTCKFHETCRIESKKKKLMKKKYICDNQNNQNKNKIKFNVCNLIYCNSID